MSYVKLHGSLLDSTVWAEPHATRIVWITLLAMADQDGLVRARAPGIASRARVTRQECNTALDCFRSPDPDSRTSDNAGVRIQDTAEGILVLNYEAHRDRATAEERAEKNAARQARWRERREKRNAQSVTGNAPLTAHNAPLRVVTRITHSEAEAEAEAKAEAKAEAASDACATPPAENHMLDPSPASSGARRARWSAILVDLRSVHGGGERYDPSPGGKHRDALDWIAAKPADEWATVLKHYAADRWVRANPGRAHPAHVRACWDRYLDGPMRAVANGKRSGPAPATAFEDFEAEPLGAFRDG